MQLRFTDENKILSEFQDEVWTVCPSCGKRAMARTDQALRKARLTCVHCGLHREVSTDTTSSGVAGSLLMPAQQYFGAALWLQHPFRDDVFFAYNDRHLHYLEAYISAKLREHRDRTHFTLLEKLPKFYHEGKNRRSLLKIIERLKARV